MTMSTSDNTQLLDSRVDSKDGKSKIKLPETNKTDKLTFEFENN